MRQYNSNKEKNSVFFTNTGCYIVKLEVIEELEENVLGGFSDIIFLN